MLDAPHIFFLSNERRDGKIDIKGGDEGKE